MFIGPQGLPLHSQEPEIESHPVPLDNVHTISACFSNIILSRFMGVTNNNGFGLDDWIY
jgi:hypothetical protein